MKCRLVLECDAESPACRLMLAAQLAEVSARCAQDHFPSQPQQAGSCNNLLTRKKVMQRLYETRVYRLLNV